MQETKTTKAPKKYRYLSDVPAFLLFRMRNGSLYVKNESGTLLRVDKPISKKRRRKIMVEVSKTGCSLMDATRKHARGFRPQYVK